MSLERTSSTYKEFDVVKCWVNKHALEFAPGDSSNLYHVCVWTHRHQGTLELFKAELIKVLSNSRDDLMVEVRDNLRSLRSRWYAHYSINSSPVSGSDIIH